jgi:hypothetical protein
MRPELSDSEIEQLLRHEFRTQLDRHLGASRRRFESAAPVAASPSIRRPAARRQQWRVVVPVAAAASLAFVFSWLWNMPGPDRSRQASDHDAGRVSHSTTDSGTAPDLWPRQGAAQPGEVKLVSTVAQDVSWKTVNAGTIYLDSQTPARTLIRESQQAYRWFDPKLQAFVEVTVPRDDVFVVAMKYQ